MHIESGPVSQIWFLVPGADLEGLDERRGEQIDFCLAKNLSGTSSLSRAKVDYAFIIDKVASRIEKPLRLKRVRILEELWVTENTARVIKHL